MERLPIELTAFLALLFAIPAHLVLPGFGAAGAPASLVALFMLFLLILGWAVSQLGGPGGSQAVSWNPVTMALATYVAMVLVSWTTGRMGLLSALAGTTSDRALITFASLTGLALFVMSRVREERVLIRLIDAVLLGATFMCAIGLVQFFAGRDLSTLLRIPGLESLKSTQGAIDTRSIFNRPFGTALHPIEFGVVAAACVPLAWWRARRSGIMWHRLILAIIALSALTSLSRSAVLALGIGVLVLFIGSSWRERVALVGVGGAFLVVAWATIPGLVGTLRSLFQNAGNDPSVQARLDRTPEVLRLMTEHLWFGRGFGTFVNEEYLLLDNEIQKMAIETGLTGVAVFVALVVTVVWTAAVTVPGRSRTPTEGLPVALMASVLGVAVSFYTFDAFFYHILTGVLYIHVGMVGVLWNINRARPPDRLQSVARRQADTDAIKRPRLDPVFPGDRAVGT